MKKYITLACLAGLTLLAGMGIHASSHREAPNISRFPQVDSSDFYMFRSYESGRGQFVTFIANYNPVQSSYGGPNFFALDSSAIYEIHVDNDGDASENLTFQFSVSNSLSNDGKGISLTVGGKTLSIPLKHAGAISADKDANLGFIESYTLNLVKGDRRTGSASAVTNSKDGSKTFAKPYDNPGKKTFPNYESYARKFIHDIKIPECATAGRVFVGQRRDSFKVSLGPVFDLVNAVPVEGDSAAGKGDGKGFPGGITQSKSNNDLEYSNLTTFALEIPIECLTGAGNGSIGAWTTASLPQARLLNPTATFALPEVNAGAFTQVSRLGNPLVNELVIGLKDKDGFSSSKPKNDGQFADYVTNPTLPALLNLLFKDAVNSTLKANIADLAPTNFPRNDLVAAFLTGFKGVNQLQNVTASEMLRLNTGIAPKAKGSQSTFGVAGDDLAGFPNGRRPGDDVVDIALRVVMGALCYKIPVNGTPTDLSLCKESEAAVGNVAFTDGSPISDQDFDASFPYLTTPVEYTQLPY